MASYHFSAKIIGRSEGRSAVAAAAYRSGSRIERAETGDCPDYRRKGGIVSAEILAPDDAPAWASDRAQLWNRVEAKESRSNSQLAREFELALPHELSPAEARDLVTAWARDELVSRGMIVDLCIHDPEPVPGSNRNLHAHLMMTMRKLDPGTADGWAKGKARDWNSPDLLVSWRESWAAAQNRALERVSAKVRVHAGTLERQAAEARAAGNQLVAMILDRPPEPRLGVAAGAIEKRAARHRGPAYKPVTDRGRDLAQARSLRASLFQAVFELYREARRVFVLVKQRPVLAPEASSRRHAEERGPALGDDFGPSF